METDLNPFAIWLTIQKWHKNGCNIGALAQVMKMDVNQLHPLLREYRIAEADGKPCWPKNPGLTAWTLLFILAK